MRQDLSDLEKRRLVAKVIEVGVLSVMRNHVYRWRDKIWIQTLGVPIGLRLSGVVGRITMDHWRLEMCRLMKENAMVEYLLEKYVDDCEVLTENLAPGTRWNGTALVTTEEAAAEDRAQHKPQDQITMDALGDMASSIVPGLKFTTDCCSKNADGKVPMLDFALWKVQEKDSASTGPSTGTPREALRYTFYEKNMANPKVMDNSSAMPHKTKLASLAQEGVRCLSNTSREMELAHLCMILSRFMRKLQKSGYAQRTNIPQASVTTFRKKLRAEVLGIQPLHRLSTHNQDARRREKLTGKSMWYLPSKLGWKQKLASKEKELGAGQQCHDQEQKTSSSPPPEGSGRSRQPRSSPTNTSQPARPQHDQDSHRKPSN